DDVVQFVDALSRLRLGILYLEGQELSDQAVRKLLGIRTRKRPGEPRSPPPTRARAVIAAGPGPAQQRPPVPRPEWLRACDSAGREPLAVVGEVIEEASRLILLAAAGRVPEPQGQCDSGHDSHQASRPRAGQLHLPALLGIRCEASLHAAPWTPRSSLVRA